MVLKTPMWSAIQMRRRLISVLAAALLCAASVAPSIAHAQADQDNVATVSAPQESHLPAWVQTVADRASLYAADTATDRVLTSLDNLTYLRVIDGGTNRLQVQAYDQNGRPGQSGWVDADQVEPSAAATDWLIVWPITTLWSTDEASATALRGLSPLTPLQRVDGPVLNRIHVRVYQSDFSGVTDQGWVDVSDTAPALSPQARVPSPVDQMASASSQTSVDEPAFLGATAQLARQAMAVTQVPASVTVAQAVLESDWGRSALAQNANNYFGLKAAGALGDDGVVWLPTSEYDASGNLYTTNNAFRAYKSLADSVADHDQVLQTASRYAPAMQASSDPRQFATLIAQEGYSTDPDYADKLIALMDRYNLYQLDS